MSREHQHLPLLPPERLHLPTHSGRGCVVSEPTITVEIPLRLAYKIQEQEQCWMYEAELANRVEDLIIKSIIASEADE